MKCGLLGRKLGHSYSPQIHALLGEYPYELYETEPDGLERFLLETDLTGFNVTIPYKKAIIPYLDALSPIAKRLGAVNTVVKRPDGTLLGHNTDYYGFQAMVTRSGIDISGKKALVLGSGGASNTAVAVLEELGAEVVVISRSGENNYGNLHLHRDAALIVNATPVGMYPNTGESPVDLELFPYLEGVLDVIYNPARTKLLLSSEELGIPCSNGLWMLVAQAKEAAECFTGKAIPDEVIGKIHSTLCRQMQNIVLIGMPGCGKSTVAKALSRITGKPAVDSDDMVRELAGKSIPDLFAQHGEAVFRSYETKALEVLGKASATIISTGGGCVTRTANLPLLRQNGCVFWLCRDLDKLPTDGRPLSQRNSLSSMYEVRRPMYEAFADSVIDNNGSIEATVESILRQWEEMQ